MAFLQKYLKRWLGYTGDDALQKWQEKCLFFILFSVAIASFPPLIKSLVRVIHDGLWFNGAAYLLGFILNLFLVFHKNIRFKIRAWTGVIIFTIMGLVSFVSIGPVGSGRVWFFTGSLFATLILGIRAGIAVLLVQIGVLVFIALQLDLFLDQWAPFFHYSGDIHFTTSFTFIFLSIVCIVAMGGLIRGLSSALAKSSQSRRDLLETTRQLNNQVNAHQKSKTLLKESEERWAFALEGAGDGVWDWDLNDDLAYFSPRWKSILGYDDHELGSEICIWLDRIHPDDRPAVLDAIDSSINGEFSGFQDRYRLRQKDGSYVWVMNRGKVMTWNKNGTPHRIIGTLTDISFIKRLEDEKADYDKNLQQIQKMEAVGTLAGGIAHDFNNILTPILGYTELAMSSDKADGEMRENLEEIYIAATRAKELVRQILTFSRQDVVQARPLNVVIIVKEVLKLLRSTIPASITIHQNIQPDCGMINSDPIQMHQVIMNLMANAYHAVENTEGEIYVALCKEEVLPGNKGKISPGSYACLTIADTGEGISEEVKDKIFDPFFTTKQEGKGTGLGLSVVLGIVQDMGGFIEFESNVGKGTEFKIYFPLLAIEPSAENTSVHVTQTGSGHIMLVDDEKSVLNVQKNMLIFLGYTVTPFNSSEEALKQFKATPDQFDLVITDMEMPILSGGKLAGKIKEIRPDIPLILCSGFSEKVSEEKIFTKDIDSFLTKPVSMAEMSNRIRETLQRKSG